MRGPGVIHMGKILVACLCVLAATASFADGDQPIEALRRGVEEALRILKDPEFNAADRKDAQQQKLRIILKRLFDFKEFSRRVLASNWKNFTPAQREAFVSAFADFLAKFYLGQLQERYKDETLIYVGQQIESATRALVNIKVVWRGQKIPVELLMLKSQRLWKVYDIQLLGFSAVRSYRAQFQFILQTETPDQVIKRLKMKTEELEKEDYKGL
jgi:phospholipid transport system substrate-binding protein